jgi:mannan endo-1,4-beta-mannosidase
VRFPSSVIVSFLLACAFSCAAPATRAVRLEAEDAQLSGLEVASSAGAARRLVTGFDEEEDSVTFHVTVPEGLYEVRIGYGSPHGEKGYSLTVNSRRTGGMFPGTGTGFGVQPAGRFLLGEGENRITVGKGWGWFDIDYIELVPAESSHPRAPAGPPADAYAGPAARALYGYLCDIYGRQILAGQYEFREIDWVDLQPAVGGFDFMDYSPSRRGFGADPHGLVERIVDWARSGGIVTVSWHWNAPMDLINEPGGEEWWRGFYTFATDFDLEAALADPSSERYRLLLRDMDAVAVELGRLQDAGVPVLWRPLHEASGGWFWWGAKGPGPFVELWRLMFRRYTEENGLHNLIWVYTPAGNGDFDEWYPGDEFVDVIAPDVYTGPNDPMTGAWDPLQRRFNGRKLLALGETGSFPPQDASARFGVWWSWFCVWGDMVRRIPVEDLRAGLSRTDVITKEELPGQLAEREIGDE